jgi:hypothetical protein
MLAYLNGSTNVKVFLFVDTNFRGF